MQPSTYHASSEPTLADLGERRLIQEVLAVRYRSVKGFGDDCAILPTVRPGATMVVTTDPCPEPMAAMLGYSDPFYRGWLLATINLSDLAAAGANPTGVVTSLILPRDFPLASFDRLLDGIDAACAASGTGVIGGNLKEGPTVELSATAFGAVDGAPFSRSGAQVGDWIGVVGDLGSFWAGTLASRDGLSLAAEVRDELMAAVLTPRARVSAARALRDCGLVSACMDNSDGLGPSLVALAQSSSVRIEVVAEDVLFSDAVNQASDALGVEPFRLALGWGDWNLVAAIAHDRVDEARRVVEAEGDRFTIVGRVQAGMPGVTLRRHGDEGELTAPDSERFAADSWFTVGIDAYIEQLVHGDLIRGVR